MTRLQYSGRKCNSAAPSWKHTRPASKKWVRVDDKPDPSQETTAATQPVTRHRTNWGTHSWKRSVELNEAGGVEMGLTVPQQMKAPLFLSFKETEQAIQVDKTEKGPDRELDVAKDVGATSSAAENANTERIPYKASSNKLVLQRKEETESRDDKDKYIKHKANSLRLVRGETKPLAAVDDTTKAHATLPQNPDSSAVCKYSRTAPQFTKKRKRPPPPKRINVDSAATNSIGGQEGKESDGNDEAEKSDETKKEGKNAKMLTDFAYRETKFRTRGINQGLVRVQKDSAKICPTFLKGIECTNVRCMNRHDVPAELAMPICSYFQRKGMCLKEDCKFRHVKVSVSASDCPNFVLKGYCDDASCKLMHRNRKRAPVSDFRK